MPGSRTAPWCCVSRTPTSSAARKLTPERFKALVNHVKAETGAKGKELFHPIRVAITGTHSGPEFDKLVPVIEEGSRLRLPHIASVRERVQAFMAAWEKLTTDLHG